VLKGQGALLPVCEGDVTEQVQQSPLLNVEHRSSSNCPSHSELAAVIAQIKSKTEPTISDSTEEIGLLEIRAEHSPFPDGNVVLIRRNTARRTKS
jgi:hypothetical protein